jgi:iron complex transport system ATP-binding protein
MSNAIEISDLSVTVNNKVILEQISIEIPKNRFTAIIGPNGAGKSFLLRNLAGLNEDSHSTLKVNNQKFDTYSQDEIAKTLSWNPERIDIPFNYRTNEVCLMGRYAHHKGTPTSKDIEIIEDCFRLLNIEHLANRSILELSSGEKKKVFLARTISSHAPIILLDEPTANLDIEAKSHLIDALKKHSTQGTTVVAVIHDISLAYKYSDNIILLNRGRVVATGSPETVLTSENIKEVFHSNSEIVKLENGDSHLVTF